MKDIPWGNNQNLKESQFYNRKREIITIKSILDTTKDETPPDILLTGIRGVGKTVFLRKIQKEMENEYLTIYMDFSQAETYRHNKLTVKGLMDFYYKKLISESNNSKLDILNKKIQKYFKTNDFFIKEFTHIKEFPIPIPGSETNEEDLINFALTFPEKLYEENKDKIKGIIIIIDEFQIIKNLNDYKESFLWKLRSYIQNQRNIAYVFSGSMSLQDELIAEIAGENGAFGGRMLTFHLTPFSQTTVKNYLTERIPELIFNEKSFKRFYKCTSGIPSYVNIFAKLLPKNIELTEEDIIKEFNLSIQYIGSQLVIIWSRLTYREQTIIISLIDKPKKRIEIANEINLKSGSLSPHLINLQNLSLIQYEDNKYSISEPILKRWLKLEYEKTGVYPI